MKKIQTKQIVLQSIFALAFGAGYWLLLEALQPEIVNRIYNCGYCERCANILYDKEQIILAFCAGLAFLILAFLNVRGFKGVLKTVAVSYLCFQVYSLSAAWSVVRSEECTALHRTRAPFLLPLIFLGIELLITSGLWAGICAAPLLILSAVRSVVFENDEEFQSLDLNAK